MLDEALIDAVYINSSQSDNSDIENFNLNIYHYVDTNKLKKMNFFDFRN
jgi:hypothetical protein